MINYTEKVEATHSRGSWYRRASARYFKRFRSLVGIEAGQRVLSLAGRSSSFPSAPLAVDSPTLPGIRSGPSTYTL